jgi:DNA-binding GntR family transcriptional regulator
VPDPSDPRPPYLAVADRLKERIAAGEFAQGSPLPSGRELAGEYAVAPNTVLSAIRQLRDEGLVIAEQGRGTFVRDGAVERLLSGKLDTISAAMESLTVRVRDLEHAAQATRPREVTASSSVPASTES